MAAKTLPTEDIDLDDIQTLEAFCNRFGDIATESRMRWLIFNREANGLAASGAIIKKVGRWHVVVPRMKNWLLSA
jgi:hypothetical protein